MPGNMLSIVHSRWLLILGTLESPGELLQILYVWPHPKLIESESLGLSLGVGSLKATQVILMSERHRINELVIHCFPGVGLTELLANVANYLLLGIPLTANMFSRLAICHG